MSSYLTIAALAALLVLLGQVPFLRVLRAFALPFAGLALAAGGQAAVEALHLEGTAWASAAEVAFLVFLGYLAGRAAMLLLFEWILVRRVGLAVPHVVRDVVSLVVNVVLIAAVLKMVLGIELGALLATSAVLTVILGLALQQTLGNLLAGIAIAWEGRLGPGQWVRVGEVMGQVVEPGWRSVVLRTVLDERVVIPNSRLTDERITLLGDGRQPVAIEVHLSVSYAASPEEVHRVLAGVVRDLPAVASEPAPQIFTRDLGDNGILYACRVWTTRPFADSALRHELLTRAFAALTRAGMEIPFPQQTMHVAPRPPKPDHTGRILRAFSACDLFRGLPEEPLSALAASSRLLRFAGGEAVVREGEGSSAMYAIAAGEAEVTQARAGRVEVVGRLGAGQTFGDVAFLRGTPRLATVSARGPLEVVEIAEGALRDVLTEAPELAEELARRVAGHELATSEATAAGAGAPRSGRAAVAELLSAILRRFGLSG